MAKIRVTVWSEGLDPVNEPKAVAVYPDDINTVIGGFLAENEDMEITLHNIREPENGLTQETIDNTNVLVWWGHMYQDEVSDKVAARVAEAVLNGMGLLLLHSSMGAKPARVLLGKCSNTGKYREIGERERVWVVDRSHPVVAGLEKEYIEVEKTEMYGEPYGIPNPDNTVFISWFEGGEVLRSGVSWHRGAGKIFFFAPGHEEYPIYYDGEIQKVIRNCVRWLCPINSPKTSFHGCLNQVTPLSPINLSGKE